MSDAPEVTVSEPVASLTDRYGGPAAADVVARLKEADMQEIKAVVSWRGAVLSDDVCVVNLAYQYLRLLQEESCGRCGPCRIGTDILREQLEKLAKGDTGDGEPESTIAKIRRLAESIEDSAWCGIGNTIRDPIIALMDLGAEHFTAHAAGQTCEASTMHGWVTAPCRSTCPSTLDIPAYIFQGLEEHPHLATTIVKRDNPLPAIIGRTCPHPCEKNCTLAPIGQPIAINNIKRWCADRAEGLADDRRASGGLLDPVHGATPKAVASAGGISRIAGGPHEISELMTAQISQRPIAVPLSEAVSRGTCGDWGGGLRGGGSCGIDMSGVGGPAHQPETAASDSTSGNGHGGYESERVSSVGEKPYFGGPGGSGSIYAEPHEGEAKTAGSGKKVAVIGAGPAGLACAYYLARLGYKPTIFEDLPVPGGMVHVGIPEYRLPRHVIFREAELIQREGVEIRYSTRVGRDISWEDLEKEFEATFVGLGAHLGRPMGIPGEDLPGSMDAIEFLRKVALHEPVEIGDDVLVLGGGNSAMDAARTAVRLGAKRVKVVYRRTRNEMPANPWEIEEAEEEGVEFLYLALPVECRGVAEEGVQELVCQQMELGEPDESGRRKPVPTDMAPFVLAADSIIAAVGQKPDFVPFQGDESIKFNRWGYMEVDPHTLMTTKQGVFVGGDAVSGGGTIIEAIGAGKTAAKYIDKYLRGEPVVEDVEDKTRRLAVYLGAQESRYPLAPTVDYGEREKMPVVPVEVRIRNFEPVELGYTLEQEIREADRCLRCHRPILIAT